MSTLLKGLKALGGYRRAVKLKDREEVVDQPYDLTVKARWNAAKNIEILQRHIATSDKVALSIQRDAQAFRKALEVDGKIPKEREVEFQTELKRVNARFEELAAAEIEVDGLLKIPARGLNLKTSPIPPAAIADIMLLLDGEPDLD
jgi:hypothetical protein